MAMPASWPLALALLGSLLLVPPVTAQPPPIPVKVVVVAMFEIGAETGDRAGELQLWVERKKLHTVFPFPQGYRDLRMNDAGVLAVLTGVGTARAAATVMALGTDPRFDLTKAYWLIAGIGGVDPADATLGSAAWAEWIVDGDLAHEIDAREIPADWKTGFVPLRKAVPYEPPKVIGDTAEVFRLDPALVEWAFRLTRDVTLPDTEQMRTERARYTEEAARRAPFVLKGDSRSGGTFFLGRLLTQWANDWIKYHTLGQGEFVTTAMEDTGTLQSLTFLARAGRVDFGRVLVLRAASDFTIPPPAVTAAEALAHMKGGRYIGLDAAVESAYRAGTLVVEHLVAGWEKYRDTPPGRR
jgi:purine nucleoside permease